MGRIVRTVGVALVSFSALAVLQTVREVVLWELGDRAYTEESPQGRTFGFAGHTFTVTSLWRVTPKPSSMGESNR